MRNILRVCIRRSYEILRYIYHPFAINYIIKYTIGKIYNNTY